MSLSYTFFYFFFFNDTATTEIYTLSLHDALPISFCHRHGIGQQPIVPSGNYHFQPGEEIQHDTSPRSEEHTSELQSQSNLVCRLLLEKKKKQKEKNSNVQHTNQLQHIACN